jgi:glycosyltransferase involved in cell wall biosynthesis
VKILFLLTQDLESPSGLGRYWPMARALAAHGHQVRIVALHPAWSDLKKKSYIRESVFVEYAAPSHVIKIGNQKQYYSPIRLLGVAIYATWALSKAALSAPADIIHLGKPHPMNCIAGFLASRLKSKILCLDCDDYEAGSNRFNNSWQKKGVAFFESKMPHYVRLVTTNTLFMKSKLLSWGCPEERIFYLPNGIDRDRFLSPNQEEVSQLRTQLGLDGKRPVLYLGSLSLPSHPVDLLLKSFVQVFQKYPDTVLLIVGGGEDYEKLMGQSQTLGINHATIFTGHVSSSKVPLYYALAELSVDPVYDNDAACGRSPLKLFESWESNVPFISSTVGDRSSLLGSPPAGLLCKPGDPNNLGEAIIQLLSNKELANQYRQLGQERVKRFYWEILERGLEEAYLQARQE